MKKIMLMTIIPALVIIGAVYFSGQIDTETFLIIIGVYGVTSAFVFIIMKNTGLLLNRGQLMKTGVTGKVTIASATMTGTRINYQPQVLFYMHVEPENGNPFQMEAKAVIQEASISKYAAGTTHYIKFDPKKPQTFVFMGAPMKYKTENGEIEGYITPEMNEMNVMYKLIKDNGVDASAEILEVWDLGFEVPGLSTGKGFKLRVIPAGEPEFNGETKAMVKNTSLEKYSPGAILPVKYLAGDKSKIAFAGSGKTYEMKEGN